jgi:hypothetical protein
MIDLIAILDRSGSMLGKEDDVIGGFNKFIKDQKNQPGDAYITLVLFDHNYDVVYNRINIKDMPELTRKTYCTLNGYTAMLDAVGKTLTAAATADKAIVFVFTDGKENASKEYTRQQIKDIIQAREKKGWEIHFIGANFDAYAEAESVGIRAAHTQSHAVMDANTVALSTAYMSVNSLRYRSEKK